MFLHVVCQAYDFKWRKVYLLFYYQYVNATLNMKTDWIEQSSKKLMEYIISYQ